MKTSPPQKPVVETRQSLTETRNGWVAGGLGCMITISAKLLKPHQGPLSPPSSSYKLAPNSSNSGDERGKQTVRYSFLCVRFLLCFFDRYHCEQDERVAKPGNLAKTCPPGPPCDDQMQVVASGVSHNHFLLLNCKLDLQLPTEFLQSSFFSHLFTHMGENFLWWSLPGNWGRSWGATYVGYSCQGLELVLSGTSTVSKRMYRLLCLTLVRLGRRRIRHSPLGQCARTLKSFSIVWVDHVMPGSSAPAESLLVMLDRRSSLASKWMMNIRNARHRHPESWDEVTGNAR